MIRIFFLVTMHHLADEWRFDRFVEIAGLDGRNNHAVERKRGQRKRKSAALLRPALGPDLAALSRHQLFADIQAQSKALAAGLNGGLGCLVEAFKESLGKIRAETASGIRHLGTGALR